MSREELKLALIGVLVESVDDGMIEATEEKILFDLKVADRLLAALNPLLERVATGLEPFATIKSAYVEHPGTRDDWQIGPSIRVGDVRQAASLHTELKGLLS